MAAVKSIISLFSIGVLSTTLVIASITKAIVSTHMMTIPVSAPITSALA
jgi:hypothetical protein